MQIENLRYRIAQASKKKEKKNNLIHIESISFLVITIDVFRLRVLPQNIKSRASSPLFAVCSTVHRYSQKKKVGFAGSNTVSSKER